MVRPFLVDEAQIVALFMECIVYGIYLVTLWITARALFWDQAGERKRVNWPMFVVMCLMAVFATLDVAMRNGHSRQPADSMYTTHAFTARFPR